MERAGESEWGRGGRGGVIEHDGDDKEGEGREEGKENGGDEEGEGKEVEEEERGERGREKGGVQLNCTPASPPPPLSSPFLSKM